MNAVEKLIATAEAEIGYLEKKSNKDLDSKTANAGSNNYTKYNRDLKAWTGVGYISAQWCQAFVDWVFIKAFGLDEAKKLIGVWTNYTPTGSDWFKKKGKYIKRGKGKPKKGDVIYFYSSAKGRIGHVGIVYKVSGNTVYTIEGNTSGASTLVTNGGGVKKKSYNMSSTYIDGYGSVDYSVVTGGGSAPATVLANGAEGTAVLEMQKKLALLGYDLGAYGCDGDFGDDTETALKAFQKDHGLTVNGRLNDATAKALDAAAKSANKDKVEITGNLVNVRESPSVKAAILGTVKRGEKLEYKGEKSADGWHQIVFGGKDGWVSGKYSKLVM